MRLLIIGCEFVGKTTLAAGITAWGLEHLGQRIGWHDEFLNTDEQNQGLREDLKILSTTSRLTESYRHYKISYHLNPAFFQDNDHCLVGWYFTEAVYAPLYDGYGGKGQKGDLEIMAGHWDKEFSALAPDAVLVTMKASAEVIRSRMAADDAQETVQQSGDVEAIIERFDELAARSFIRRRVALDTTEATREQTMAQFMEQMEPHLTQCDRMRLLTHTRGV